MNFAEAPQAVSRISRSTGAVVSTAKPAEGGASDRAYPPDLWSGPLDVTRRLGRLLPADRCPSCKHCPGCDRIGGVGVGELAHLTGEPLGSVSAPVASGGGDALQGWTAARPSGSVGLDRMGNREAVPGLVLPSGNSSRAGMRGASATQVFSGAQDPLRGPGRLCIGLKRSVLPGLRRTLIDDWTEGTSRWRLRIGLCASVCDWCHSRQEAEMPRFVCDTPHPV